MDLVQHKQQRQSQTPSFPAAPPRPPPCYPLRPLKQTGQQQKLRSREGTPACGEGGGHNRRLGGRVCQHEDLRVDHGGAAWRTRRLSRRCGHRAPPRLLRTSPSTHAHHYGTDAVDIWQRGRAGGQSLDPGSPCQAAPRVAPRLWRLGRRRLRSWGCLNALWWGAVPA